MISVLRPTYDDQTKKELLEVLDSGWTGQGPKTKEFELAFAEYVGAKYAIATNSATSALDLCIKVYGLKGGELITPAFTFVSDAIVGEWNGMDVTFADIDPRTLCIDPESIKITHETKVIIAVDCHGRLADIDAIREKAKNKPCPQCYGSGKYSPLNHTHEDEPITCYICKGNGIDPIKPLIIEDAAHAMYTPGVGRGDICVYSFQAVKSMPIFDGGMITTNDPEIAKKLRTLTWLGVEKSTFDRVGKKGYTWQYDITQAEGIKAYMTDVQAVIGIGQMRRLEQTNQRRRDIQKRYNIALKVVPGFVAPKYSHTVQYYTPEWENRDGLCEFLADNDIATSVHFQPLNKTTYWAKAEKTPLTVTNEVWLKLLSLPCHNALTDDEQEYIIKKVKEFYKCEY